MTLKRVLNWTSHGTVDLDNTRRENADTEEIPFQVSLEHDRKTTSPNLMNNRAESSHIPKPQDIQDPSIHLPLGSYLIEFNETVSVPLDVMGQLYVRSSLFRSGALLNAGVLDSGYEGAVGALLQVLNPHGLRLFRDARLAQFVFHQMSEKVEGYDGVYQGRTAM